MRKSFSLQAVLELAQRQSADAVAKLGALNTELAGSEAKLKLLLHYRDEYQVRFRSAAARTIDSAGWKNFHDFMAKLDEAIEQQRSAVAHSRERMLSGQREWHAKRRKAQAFDTLAERHEANVARHEARREARVADDLTVNRVLRHKASG